LDRPAGPQSQARTDLAAHAHDDKVSLELAEKRDVLRAGSAEEFFQFCCRLNQICHALKSRTCVAGKSSRPTNHDARPHAKTALSLGERVSGDGVVFSRRRTGEGLVRIRKEQIQMANGKLQMDSNF
jgi:hypothetical protein